MVLVFPLREKIFPPFRQCYPMLTDEQEDHQVNNQTVKCIDMLKSLINQQAYSLSMAILTIYSIFAIDVQKSSFGQNAAYVFGYVHIVCIVVFVVDMIFSWVCKEDFKWSFYFWIDVISTASMVMEITWVDNFLTVNSDLPAVLTLAKVVKASRLSRIGGRAAKIILMFLAYLKAKKKEEERLKNQMKATESMAAESNLYKTTTAIEGKTQKEENQFQGEQEILEQVANQLPNKLEINKMQLDPIVEEMISERSSVEDQIPTPEKMSLNHSKDSVLQVPVLLGKKRSKLIRDSDNFSNKKRTDRGKVFDITNIVERMEQTFKVQPLQNRNAPEGMMEDIERKWSQLCQKEEEARKQSREKIKSNKENFRLGEILKQRIQKNIIIMIMSLIIILPLISADTWFNKDPTIDQLIQNYFQLADSFNDTSQRIALLQEMINAAETGTYPILFLQTTDGLTYPGNIMPALAWNPPLSDYMQSQITQVVGSDYTVVFNGRNISQLNAIINIARSCFITVLLIFSTIIFMYSIEINALSPLQQMSVSINKISINPFDALREFNESEEKEDTEGGRNQLQTNILQDAVKKMTKILALGAGEAGSQLILNTVEASNDSNYSQLNGSKVHGIFLCIKLTYFQKLCSNWQDNIIPTINQISTYMHDIIMENGGMIIDNNPPYYLFFWNTPDDLNIQQETTKFFVAGNPLKNLGKTIETQKIIQVALRSYLQINIALSELNKKWIDQVHPQDQFEPYFLQAGFHIGDAYKGPVGSTLKIEVKCMGENIKFTKALCELAPRYHLSNIVSQEVSIVMDDLAEMHLRKIDCVREKEDEQSKFWLYTYDFSLYSLMDRQERRDTQVSKKKKRIRKPEKTFRQKKQRSLVLRNRQDTLSKLKTDPIDIVMPFSSTEKKCLKIFSDKFYLTWNYAIDHYYSGEWDEALPLFESINERFDLGYKDPISLMFIDRIGTAEKQPQEGWEQTVQIQFE